MSVAEKSPGCSSKNDAVSADTYRGITSVTQRTMTADSGSDHNGSSAFGPAHNQ